MAKQSRRVGRRDRPSRRKIRATTTAGQLKIFIATSPRTVNGQASLAEDVRLVRSALLYADKVELVSPAAQMIGSVSALGATGPAGLAEVIAALDDDTLRAQGHDPDKIRMALTVSNATRETLRRQLGPLNARKIREHVTSMLESQRQGLEDVIRNIERSSGSDELSLALERNVLTVSTPDDGGVFDMEQYVESLKGIISSPHSHLLFDEQISRLVGAMIREGKVEPHRLMMTRAGQATTGAGMVQRLHVFPDASIESILDVREELREPLSNYRIATVQLAGRLKANPFDDDIEPELDDLWRNAVEPAVEAIHRSLSKTRLLRDVVTDAVTDIPSWVATGFGSYLTMGVADLAPVPGLLITAAGTASVSALKQRISLNSAAESNQLYYLYELERRLR